MNPLSLLLIYPLHSPLLLPLPFSSSPPPFIHRLFYRCGPLPSTIHPIPRMVDTQGYVMADVIRRRHEDRLEAGGTEIDKDNVSQTGAGGETQATNTQQTDTANTPETKTGEGGEGGEEKDKTEEEPQTDGSKKKKKKKKKRDRRDKYRGNPNHLKISLIFAIIGCCCFVLGIVDIIASVMESNKGHDATKKNAENSINKNM